MDSRATGTAGPSESTVTADWDDVDTAVEAGAGWAECAAGKAEISGNGLRREYPVKHVSGREGRVIVVGGAGAADPRPIRVECRMGPLRDVALERTVVRGVERRLTQLRGKDVAPAD